MISRNFLAFSFVALLFACKKNSSSQTKPSTASMTFMDSAIQLTSVSATGSGSGVEISGADAMKTASLALILRPPFLLNNTVDMDSVGDYVQVTVTGRPDQWGGGFGWSPGDAKLTITSWDSVGHRMSGTFSGILSGGTGYSDTLSAGKFDVQYTVN